MTGSIELAAHAILRRDIQAAVRRGNSARVIALVLSKPYGLEVLAGGFGGDLKSAARVSFAEYCVRRRQPQVLIGVVEGTPGHPPAQMLQAATTWSNFNKIHQRVVTRTRSLFQQTCDSYSLDFLRVAVRLEPDFAGLSAPVGELASFYPQTVHARMLHAALFEHDHETVDGAIACCRFLLERGAPVLTEQSATPVAEWFVCAREAASRGEELLPLLHAYAAAGFLDPSTRFGDNATRHGVCKKLPLLAAIEQANCPVAVGLIAAGCDLEAVDAELRSQGHADLPGKIRFVAASDAEEFVAQVNEALMRRRMSEHLTRASELQAVASSARPRRAAL